MSKKENKQENKDKPLIKKVKSILVSQPKPQNEKSPYFNLSKKLKVKVDFRPFIHVEGASVKDVRRQKIDLSQYDSIIFTSRTAIDHYFRIAEEMRYNIPNTNRYFTPSETVAKYLQKYIVYRKRRIFYGDGTLKSLGEIIKKYPQGKFLLPSSDKLKPEIPQLLNSLGINWKSGMFFKTVISDLSDLADVYYDVLVFFSPSGIESLFHNFPDFKQNDTRIAVFGNNTYQAALDRGLRVDIKAPTKETPSMTMALEKYIKEANKRS
ncbi:MAG: uroporphyrinogen-III synthase [Chlorobi bacterium]|nr:uroporphyrinogen-III synthase [Chlorobiota bacterium]